MNQIGIYDGADIAEIRATVDLAALLKKIKQIDALKVALESCDQFRENAIRYAKLEAAALIRVVELGGAAELHGHRRKAAEWLYSLTETERNEQIQKCAEGLTVDQVWERDVLPAIKDKETARAVAHAREAIIEKAKESGYADMKEHEATLRCWHVPARLIPDIVDGTRNALRKAGAVAVGYHGVYVMPDAADKSDVEHALAVRLKSVMDDIFNIAEIAKEASVKMTCQGFLCELPQGRWGRERNHPATHSVLRALYFAGAIDENDTHPALWEIRGTEATT